MLDHGCQILTVGAVGKPMSFLAEDARKDMQIWKGMIRAVMVLEGSRESHIESVLE